MKVKNPKHKGKIKELTDGTIAAIFQHLGYEVTE